MNDLIHSIPKTAGITLVDLLGRVIPAVLGQKRRVFRRKTGKSFFPKTAGNIPKTAGIVSKTAGIMLHHILYARALIIIKIGGAAHA